MKKPLFTLSRKNQKGQVAIFVALIFQILFVFFAILINVGLLVHHKINLQQSADLAAYYGAMKQAESLNAIAHINFQIKQAWKLFAWRYRIVGTFGFQKTNDVPAIPTFPPLAPTFPVTLNYTGLSRISTKSEVDDGSCIDPNGLKVNTATHPFFCIGHGGMKGWRGGPEENICKINCKLITTTSAYTVTGVPNLNVIINNGISDSIKTAISEVNKNLENLCNSVGPVNINVLAKMILGYSREVAMRSQTLLMLAGNLSQEKFLDLDGNEVLTGVTNTFKNNLTEANLDSGPNLKFKAYNSLSDANCSMEKDIRNAGKKTAKTEFLKRIEFDLIQIFIHDCSSKSKKAGDQNFRSGSIYKGDFKDLSDGTDDPTGAKTPKVNTIDIRIREEILRLVTSENEKYTTGYEKNPWCPAYYFVTASSEPTIPFLPLIKIPLTAKAVAKPFGGTVGPWYGKKWDSGQPHTQDIVTYNNSSLQTDESLPAAKFINSSVTTKAQVSRLLPNFGRFVGDNLGLSDPEYVGEYHAALINRKPDIVDIYGTSKKPDGGNGSLSEPTEWPSISSWDDIVDTSDTSNYDPLANGVSKKDSYLRDLEISAIAPNQFDLTYYSIDPDFYENYYVRLSNPTIFNKLKQSSQLSIPSNFVRTDFGNNKKIIGEKPNFSVRHQIETVKRIIAPAKTGLVNSKLTMLDAFPYLVTKQSSLLSGWTFKNFSDFDAFPGDDVNSPDGTMSFARCKDDWNNENKQTPYGNPVELGLPPTPGNCVTGGRVGYSVKMVSPSMLRSSAAAQPLGGPGTSGKILNPIPEDLLNQ